MKWHPPYGGYEHSTFINKKTHTQHNNAVKMLRGILTKANFPITSGMQKAKSQKTTASERGVTVTFLLVSHLSVVVRTSSVFRKARFCELLNLYMLCDFITDTPKAIGLVPAACRRPRRAGPCGCGHRLLRWPSWRAASCGCSSAACHRHRHHAHFATRS